MTMPANIMPTKPKGYPAEVAHYAESLASIQQMHEELRAAHEMIGQLKADLQGSNNRCEMILEERNRYRAEALVFRSKLIELATSMANIGLMTQTAQDVVKTVHELTIHAETPSTDVITKMEQDLLQLEQTKLGKDSA